MGEAYRSLTGHHYRSTETGNEKRANPGDKIEDMNEVAIRHELAAKNIEPWEPRKTENVVTEEQRAEQVEVSGTVVQGEGDNVEIQQVGGETQ